MKEDKYIYSNDLKYPLWIIAISMVGFILFIAGSLGYARLFPEEDIRIKHLEQHHDEQVKYNQMIELLERIEENSENKKD